MLPVCECPFLGGMKMELFFFFLFFFLSFVRIQRWNIVNVFVNNESKLICDTFWHCLLGWKQLFSIRLLCSFLGAFKYKWNASMLFHPYFLCLDDTGHLLDSILIMFKVGWSGFLVHETYKDEIGQLEIFGVKYYRYYKNSVEVHLSISHSKETLKVYWKEFLKHSVEAKMPRNIIYDTYKV